VLRNTLYLGFLVPSYAQSLFLALAAFNGLLWATGATSRTPFFQANVSNIVAFAAFLFFLVFPHLRSTARK